MTGPSRNDACPCGSGRKYKKCCLAREEATERLVSNLLETKESLDGKLIEFAEEGFGESLIDRAWREFWKDDRPFDPEHPEEDLFFHWLCYDWCPGRVIAADRGSVATALLESPGGGLSVTERDMLERTARVAPSFHQVIELVPGDHISLRDLLTGATCRVLEPSARIELHPGEILFGRVVDFEAGSLLMGHGMIVFADPFKWSLRDIRITLTDEIGGLRPDLLRTQARELTALYLELTCGDDEPELVADPSCTEHVGEMRDATKVEEIVYEIASADEAYAALRSIAAGESDESLRSGALIDPEGRIVEILVPWVSAIRTAGGAPEILGWIEIDDRRMKAVAPTSGAAQELMEIVNRQLPSARRVADSQRAPPG